MEKVFLHVVRYGQGLKLMFDIIKNCIFRTMAWSHSGESKEQETIIRLVLNIYWLMSTHQMLHKS